MRAVSKQNERRRKRMKVEYDENGSLKEKVSIKNGKRDGVGMIYYSNNILKAEALFKNGKPEGIIKQYYNNGTLAAEGLIKGGKREWIIEYNPRGIKVQKIVASDSEEVIHKVICIPRLSDLPL